MKYRNGDLLTPAELSSLLSLSVSTLAQWRCTGRGPAWLKIGGKVRYHSEEVDRWIEAQGKGVPSSDVNPPAVGRQPSRSRSLVAQAVRLRLGGHRTQAQRAGED